MRGAYVLCLLASWAGVLALDLRWRLAFTQRSTRARRTCFAVAAIGTAFFLVWDLMAIDAGFYGRGDSPALLGVWVVDHLPLEEVVFVAFLCHVTLVVAAAVGRLQTHATAGTRDAGTRDAGTPDAGARDAERTADQPAGREVHG